MDLYQVYKILDELCPGSNYNKTSNRLVYFSRISMEGLEEMNSYSLDKRLYEFLEFKPFEGINDTKNYLKKLLQSEKKAWPKKNSICWFIRKINDNSLIGTAKFDEINFKRKSLVWGYGIDPNLWGKGYILEIQEILKEYVFEKLKFNRISGTTMLNNDRTKLSLIASGFKEEGILRQYYRNYRGEYFDAWIYSMLSKDYFNNIIKTQIPKNSDISLEKIINIISSELKDERINQKSNMDSVLSWDSLSHLSVIMAIEEKLGLIFSTSEIAKALSVEKIYSIIKAKKNN